MYKRRLSHRVKIHRSHLHGVSLVETVISLLILSGAFVATLNTVSASRATYLTTSDRLLGLTLAEDLLAELLAKDYREEDSTLIGLDLLEAEGAGRSRYDDVDDYDGWSSSPPQLSDATQMQGVDGYTRSVEVDWVSSMSPDTPSNSDQGLKRVTVTVLRGERQIAQLVAYRAESYETAGEDE